MTPPAQRRVLYGQLVNNAVQTSKGKKAFIKHLQPGVVRYENEDGSFTTYLLELDGIAAMRPTAAGIPVVGKSGGFDHVQVEPGKKYDGVVLDSVWDGESGWEAFNADELNASTAQACEKGMQASCAYIPTETDGTPGLWHNIPYDEKILNGRYTHVAVVPNPRYEGATIELFNSTGGGVMNKVLKAALALVPFAQLKEVYNSIEEDEKSKADKEKAKADKKAENQNAYDAAMKNAKTPEEEAAAKAAFEKANADLEEPKVDLVAQPLGGGDVQPEPGIPGQDPIKKAPATNAETPEQAAEREKKSAEAAALEKANSEKAAADKLALEKKNADDAAAKEKADKAKEEDEKKNALAIKTKAEADAKAEAERTERFNALRRVAEERGGSSGSPFQGVTTSQEKEDLGRERYGSRQ